ncbi:phosphomevalonate kinase [Sporolactobacillus vineae]|uniref:phosphomevalonate kinase n=1 Tax=Sporolactobacillus vineae TaxID=444463 RepID=UPI00028973BF|nr:phosphomevalonate kinase [Sporolactobacillus vineae]
MKSVVKTPGKLYIAGEYAVVEAGCPAVIIAVDQFVTVRIAHHEKEGIIFSPGISETPLSWTRENILPLIAASEPFRFILSAIRYAEAYLLQKNRQLTYYHLDIRSELNGEDGRKYGLGSSAAVTVGTVQALLRFFGEPATKQTVFKLAAMAHLAVQGNGSCGDIAASVYGGWLAYTSFDHEWLKGQKRSGKSLSEIIAEPWPGLSVEPLTLPASLNLLVGWTGRPASTRRLVCDVAKVKKSRAADYQDFLSASSACVNRMIAGFRKQRPDWILEGIRRNRRLLHTLSGLSGGTIETEPLRRLCEIAESYHGAAKSSGAGGGDCGIVLFSRNVAADSIRREWEKAGIVPLPLQVYHDPEDQEGGTDVKESRKDEHVRLFRENDSVNPSNDFDSVKFVHHSLPGLDLADIDLAARLPLGTWKLPFYINGMTGGSEKTKRINEQLSRAAAATGVAIASGSQKAAIKNPELRDTFQVLRRVNPDGFIFANIGAELDVDDARQAVDMLEADGLQIHLNAPQEIVMPEGDRNFSHWLTHVEHIAAALDLPIVVKEVGFGMNRDVMRRLIDAGIRYIDVSGRGGTNFITIENMRRGKHEFDYLKDWGQSAVVSLLEAQKYLGSATLLASGGVRHPLDVLKALSLGAGAVGVSGTFLRAVLDGGADQLIGIIESWKQQLSQLMLMMGVRNLEQLRRQDVILSGEPYHWAKLRDISAEKLATRSWTEH